MREEVLLVPGGDTMTQVERPKVGRPPRGSWNVNQVTGVDLFRNGLCLRHTYHVSRRLSIYGNYDVIQINATRPSVQHFSGSVNIDNASAEYGGSCPLSFASSISVLNMESDSRAQLPST